MHRFKRFTGTCLTAACLVMVAGFAHGQQQADSLYGQPYGGDSQPQQSAPDLDIQQSTQPYPYRSSYWYARPRAGWRMPWQHWGGWRGGWWD